MFFLHAGDLMKGSDISHLKIVEIQTEKKTEPIGKIVEILNSLRTIKIKLGRLPAIYATTKISEEIRQMGVALEMVVLEALLVREPLRSRGSLAINCDFYVKLKKNYR